MALSPMAMSADAEVSRLSLPARIWPWLAAAGSGILLALCLPPWNLGWLAWIALTPLICAVWFSKTQTRWRPFQLGYLFGLTFFSTTFYWLSALGELFAQPWLQALPLFLALYLGLFPAFWAWFLRRICPGRSTDFLHSGRNLSTAFFGAAAWVAHEWVRGWLFSGFGWNGLGVALHEDLAMIQMVDLTGVCGLSFLVAFANLMAVILARRLLAELGPTFLKRVRWEFSLSMALIAAVFAYGVRHLMAPQPKDPPLFRIAAIQPNIPQNEKFSAAAEDRVLEQLDQLSELALMAKPDLLLWPEAATPRGIFADELNYRFVRKQVDRGSSALLLGTLEEAPPEVYNAAVLLTPGTEEWQSYRKRHLVPFGEYMPLRKSFPLFAMVAGDLVPGDLAAGQDYTLLQLANPTLKLGPLVCFEDTLGDLTRHFALKGADVLINLTNDGWFLKTAGAEQHLANSIFRAVENRRTLVRCTNTGVTCSISTNGRVDRWVTPFERGFATRSLPIPSHQTLTFYSLHGDWLAWFCSALTTLAIVRRRR